MAGKLELFLPKWADTDDMCSVWGALAYFLAEIHYQVISWTSWYQAKLQIHQPRKTQQDVLTQHEAFIQWQILTPKLKLFHLKLEKLPDWYIYQMEREADESCVLLFPISDL